MAAYFDYEKKTPHINVDDIYVKNGDVKDGKLILGYSIGDLDPLSISLSSFDKFTYIDDGEFNDNNLILKYGRPSIPNLSICLSSLDKHVNNILMSDDKTVLSLCFNDDSVITADTTKYVENFYITSWSVSGKNLLLKYNTPVLDPIVIDLESIANKIVSMNTTDNKLTINDSLGNSVSVDLEKFSYNDFIDDYELDSSNQLTLKYSTDHASGNAKDITIDLSRFAKNYYIKSASLNDETLVLKYNSSLVGDNLSVKLNTLNNYIADANIVDKTLVLSYNSDRFQPLSVNVADFIKDYYIKDVKLCSDNKLHFKYNSTDPSLYIEPVDLSIFNDHIDNIIQDTTYDTIQFNRTNGKTLPVLNLSKYVNNDITSMHIHGNSLILKFSNGSTKDVSLAKFDKYISTYATDENNLSLLYNDDKGCIVLDKSTISKAIVNAYVEDNIFYFVYSDGTPTLTVDLNDCLTHVVAGNLIDSTLKLDYSNSTPSISIDLSKLSTYVDSAVLDSDAMLSLLYNANHAPTVVNLSKLNNEITKSYTSGSNLILEFANKTTRIIDLRDFNRYIASIYLNGNDLKFVDNSDKTITISLDKFDKFIASANVDKKNHKIDFKYNTESDAFKIDLNDINYELMSGEVDDSNNITLHFSNDKKSVKIDASKLKSADTYIKSVRLDSNDVLVFDYNTATPPAIQADLHKFARNDYIAAGSYDPGTNQLILKYNDQPGFSTKLAPISVYVPGGGTGGDNFYVDKGHFDVTNKKLVLGYNNSLMAPVNIDYNILSGLSFHYSDTTYLSTVAQVLEQIVTAFGGNR